MNLSQAAKTGRKFRRKSEPGLHYWLSGKSILRTDGTDVHEGVQFDAEQITALDWEADPLSLMLNADDIVRAARVHDQLTSQRRLSAAEFAKLICIELGLTEEE